LEKASDVEHRFYASSSEPLELSQLIEWTKVSGDQHLISLYYDHSLGYAESGGSSDLRKEIANLYGSNITAKNIVVFPGAQTGMTLSAQALLHEGDHSIVVTPGYQSMEEGARLAGSEVTRVALSPKSGWQISIKAIEVAIKSNTKQIILNDPHNPSGALMTLKTKKELIALARTNNIRIFSDEVYRLLEFDSVERSPSMTDLYDKALALGTMAKPFGAGGACIGRVACQDIDVVEKLLKAQHMYAVCFFRAGEIQAMMILRQKDKIIAKNLHIIKNNLALLDEYFEENADLFDWVRPEAGAIAFVKFKGPLTS
jgi:aspartate/methionine/tyrosine aminotransferase